MLKELYDYSQGRRSGWGISRVDAMGGGAKSLAIFESVDALRVANTRRMTLAVTGLI